ncbi:MAG: transketolase [Actinobacteria bacterium]|nr:transketolase [Actinomycetota bacterium]
MDTNGWHELAAQLRVDSIRCTTAAASGHPTSSMSAADLAAVLFADHLRTDVGDPHSLANDRFVLSKGHAAPLLYAVFKAIGAISDDELLSLRTMGSPVQGHPAPVPEMPWVDVATGSLGQGLPVSLGMALAMRLDGAPGRVWCLMGDSETAEGSVWEAMAAASAQGVDNLVGIIDMNRLGQRGPTMLGWDADTYARRAQAFGWNTLEIDGHDVDVIDEAFTAAAGADRPTMIVARTEKGHGVSFLADQEGWHGKPLDAEQAERAIAELGGERQIVVTPPAPEGFKPVQLGELTAAPAPAYPEGTATRKAFGETLAWLAGHRPDVVVLDGEVGNSTHTEDFEAVAPERFFQMYIAEQVMVGAQVGLQALGKTAFSATFGAFWSRAMDFVRMAAIGRADLRLCGSHAGVSIGEDGPSQMALEDLAAMRALHGSTVLYPADGNATVKLVTAMCDIEGISYIRTTREKTPMLYEPDEEFPIGGSKTLRSSPEDRVTLVGAGITLVECLRAADALEAGGVHTRVIDLYSVKPADGATLRSALIDTGLIVTVEDHWPEGGVGDAVLDALASEGDVAGRIVKIAPREMPGSGTPQELREWAGISADRIAERVRTELV